MTFTEEQKERIEALMHECVENADYKIMKKILKSGYSMYAGRRCKNVQQLKQLVIVLADKLLTKFYEANERLDLPFQGKLEENTHEVTLKLFAQGYEETNEYINGLRVEISLQMEVTKVFEMPDENGKYHVIQNKEQYEKLYGED